MKKQSIFFLFFLACTSFAVQAQISVGPGLAYGFEVEEIGIQARGIYGFNDTWRGEADFTLYLDGDDFVSYWEFNVNGNYVFLNNDKTKVYALAGLNFFHVNIDLGQFGDASDTETGLNLGIGGELKFSDRVSGFGEAKYAISDADQLFLAIGALFHL